METKHLNELHLSYQEKWFNTLQEFYQKLLDKYKKHVASLNFVKEHLTMYQWMCDHSLKACKCTWHSVSIIENQTTQMCWPNF